MKSKRSIIEPVHEEEAAALKKIFKERAGLSQEAFGGKFEIGSQGMVWQYLNAKAPKTGSALNLEAAIKFATGLACKVEEFSPRLAKLLREDQSGASKKSSIPEKNDYELAGNVRNLPANEHSALSKPLLELLDLAKSMTPEGQWLLLGRAQELATKYSKAKANPAS